MGNSFLPYYFNSRAHARRDSYSRSVSLFISLFQLTRPRKARHTSRYDRLKSFVFQLTRPRKARRIVQRIGFLTTVFQLTRPRKARPAPFLLFCVDGQFQLTRPRKARLLLFIIRLDHFYFNSRAHARRDRNILI